MACDGRFGDVSFFGGVALVAPSFWQRFLTGTGMIPTSTSIQSTTSETFGPKPLTNTRWSMGFLLSGQFPCGLKRSFWSVSFFLRFFYSMFQTLPTWGVPIYFT